MENMNRFLGKVNDIIALRNKFAHRQLTLPLAKAIEFDGEHLDLDTRFGKDGKIKPSKLPLSDKIMADYLNEITQYMGIFTTLEGMIWNKEGATISEEEQP